MDHTTHNFHHQHQFNQAHARARQTHQRMHDEAMRQQRNAADASSLKKAKDFVVGAATIAAVGYGIYRLFK